MVPLPFLKKKKAHPSKPTIETPIEGNQEENVKKVEPEDSKSEEKDEAELSHTTRDKKIGFFGRNIGYRPAPKRYRQP